MNTTQIYKNLPLYKIVSKLTEENGKITYEDLKEYLTEKDSKKLNKYYLGFKETEELGLIYNYDQMNRSAEASDEVTELEDSCRSIILDKKNLLPIGTQYNRILYNEDAIKFLENKNWNKLVIEECFEGTMLLVYNHNDKWYVSTRRCLDGGNSKWVKDKSYHEFFDETINNKFNYDELNKDYCYHFILLHYKNRNLVNYTQLGKEYKELCHVLTTRKYTLEEVVHKLPNTITPTQYMYKNMQELQENLDNISKLNEKNNNITTEGFILKYYEGEINKSYFTILKLQTSVYKKLMKIKPNNSNIHQIYLELYQNDNLYNYLPYTTKYTTEVNTRIVTSMKTISKEILNLYHLTRQKKNSELYESLTDTYKKILYDLHGIYIENKTKQENRSINVHSVYYYLKKIPPNILRQIYYDRKTMMDNKNSDFIDKTCILTMAQTTLMSS